MMRTRRAPRGFTLMELLVSVSILALLTAILLPALSAGRHSALDLKCRAQLRGVAVQFQFFADDTGVGARGESNDLGGQRFRLEDFQESIYHIHEFWDGPEEDRLPIRPAEQPLMCPSGPDLLERRAGFPCSAGAIGPQRNVSVGFNMRLHQRTRYINGRPYRANAYLTDKVLEFPDTPLLFDVDGQAAVERRALPFYSAPPLPDKNKEPDLYIDGRFWYPSDRHRGHLNVGFIGGHVLSTASPLTEPWWRWDYQPDP